MFFALFPNEQLKQTLSCMCCNMLCAQSVLFGTIAA